MYALKFCLFIFLNITLTGKTILQCETSYKSFTKTKTCHIELPGACQKALFALSAIYFAIKYAWGVIISPNDSCAHQLRKRMARGMSFRTDEVT